MSIIGYEHSGSWVQAFHAHFFSLYRLLNSMLSAVSMDFVEA